MVCNKSKKSKYFTLFFNGYMIGKRSGNMYVNKSMNEDIKEFGVWELYYNTLRPRPDIQSIHDYSHYRFDLHHFIKAQDYKRNREWYELNGIHEKLILLPKIIHQHVEYPDYMMDDIEFYRVYHIKKDLLLFNKRKWLLQQAKRRKI